MKKWNIFIAWLSILLLSSTLVSCVKRFSYQVAEYEGVRFNFPVGYIVDSSSVEDGYTTNVLRYFNIDKTFCTISITYRMFYGVSNTEHINNPEVKESVFVENVSPSGSESFTFKGLTELNGKDILRADYELDNVLVTRLSFIHNDTYFYIELNIADKDVKLKDEIMNSFEFVE